MVKDCIKTRKERDPESCGIRDPWGDHESPRMVMWLEFGERLPPPLPSVLIAKTCWSLQWSGQYSTDDGSNSSSPSRLALRSLGDVRETGLRHDWKESMLWRRSTMLLLEEPKSLNRNRTSVQSVQF